MQITSSQQYNVGEKPTVILYIYINRHVGTPEKHQKQDSIIAAGAIAAAALHRLVCVYG